MTTYAQAVDFILARFKADWDAGTTAIVGYIPIVRWPGVEEPNALPSDKFWARISLQTVSDGQTSFRDGVNGKRYTANGLIFVQNFAPMSVSDAAAKLRALATISRDAFRKPASTVWFRNARMKDEMVADGKFWAQNVVAEFQYDDIG
jgi:hypothetical protein